jgi:crossover junction endodeoxyribonuclease RusA
MREGVKFSFTVYGHPQPQGSTRAFLPKGAKYPIITSGNPRMKSWRQEVTNAAMQAFRGNGIFQGAVRVTAYFYFLPPKGKRKMVTYKTTKPDLDKLLRCILDGLTGVAYYDDGQVAETVAAKHYLQQAECAEITVETLAN